MAEMQIRKKKDTRKTVQTRWKNQIDKEHVLEEYPRPMMVRESYINLNGLWQYAFTSVPKCPAKFQGDILVPFSPESILSGVERQLLPGEYLWYRRFLPAEVSRQAGRRWLLHFGAVDQWAAVFINRKKLMTHTGGYLPFTVDVTEALSDTEENELIVLVQDTSDTSWHARGKQRLKAGGMFYTAQSGIWQTVWMEEVPETYIRDVHISSRYDEREVEIIVESEQTAEISISVSSCEMQAVETVGVTNTAIRIPVYQMHSWTPEDPFLYDLYVSLGEDCIKSYFAMRKISREKDRNGISRLYLNNSPYLCNGVLDQGYWPEGLYTAPCDEAMIFDIREMKRLGYNTLRKHLKIEPQRWYYHCDRLGMLVWQDMVNGGSAYKHVYVTYLATGMEQLSIRRKDNQYKMLSRTSTQGREEFEQEMEQTVNLLKSHPSVSMWVIFNEGWGQFDANRLTDKLRLLDDTRLIDQASGWFDQGGGDFRSIHNYFFSMKMKPEERIQALTEYGGYSLRLSEHAERKKIYGYRTFRNSQELTRGYCELIEKSVIPAMEKGLSGLVFTQLSDVEEEVNGIYTYDREVLKLDEDEIIGLNRRLQEIFSKIFN